MRTATALLFLAFAGLFSPAHANGNATLRALPYGVIRCPFPIDNGCANSQPLQAGSGAVILSNARQAPAGNMINLLSATPTDYSVNGPQRNQVGMEFPGGEYTPLTGLLDPAISSPAWCTYNATGTGVGTPLVTCTPTSSPQSFSGFDMTRGGTTCVVLVVNGNATGLVTVSDNYWKNNGKCVQNTISPVMLNITGRTTSQTLITFNTMDADKLSFPFAYGSCSPGTNCNPTEAFFAEGAALVTYNAFIGFIARPIQFGASSPSVVAEYDYNLLVGCCSETAAAHNEYIEYITNQGGGAGGEIYIGNTFLTTTFHQNIGFGAIPVALPASFGIGPTAIFNATDNFYVDALAGGGATNTVPTYTGDITGSVFTTSAVSGGVLGNGVLLGCGTLATPEVQFQPFYNATYPGVVSAGPGGGGNSGGNAISGWDMTWAATTITAQFDDGTGTSTPGTVMTVNTDVSLVLQVGDTVAFGGTIGTRTISSFISGTGTTGTYQMSGANGLLANTAGLLATPVNIFPGGWSVPGTLHCPSQSLQGSGHAYSFAHPWMVIQGELGQVTAAGNYMDLWPYGSSPLGNVTIDINTSGTRNFTGTISGGTNLAITNGAIPSTTVNVHGSAYASAPSVAYGAGCTTTPVGTAVLGSGGTAGTVVSITQSTPGAGCSAVPSVTLSGGGGSGATATANFTPVVVVGSIITTTSGVSPTTRIVSGGPTTYVISPSQANLGPVLMTEADVFCTTGPVIWGAGTDPNVDMAGINGATIMNSFGGSAIAGNGCGP